MNRQLREFSLAGLLFLAILLLFFAPALSPQNVLSAADGLFATPAFAGSAPTDFVRPSNPLLFDQVYQFAPWRYFAWLSLRNGEWPLWNPYSSSGTPLLATMQAAVFYPINLLLTPLPFHLTFVWSAVLRLWIAGMCTYFLVRRYSISQIAAYVAAVSFMLSSFLIVWLGHPHTNAAVWLPALLLGAELLLSIHRTRAVVAVLAALSLVIGIQFTGGHIETSVDILLGFGLYYLIRWYQVSWHREHPRISLVRLLILPASAVAWGVLVASVQLLPFLEWLPLSAVFHERNASEFRWIHPDFFKHVLSLPLAIFPNLYNNPTWDYPYWSFLLRWSNYNELALYVGVLTFLLAVVAVVNIRHTNKALVLCWTIIGSLNLARAIRLPVVDLVNQVPGLALGSPERLRLIASFAVCVLAAFGAEVLQGRLAGESHRNRRLWLLLTSSVAVAGVLLLIGSNVGLPLLRDTISTYAKNLVEAEYAARVTHSNSLEYYFAEVDQMIAGLVAAFRPQNVAMYLPMIWALLGMAVLRVHRKRYTRLPNMTGVLIALIVTLDLLTFGRNYNPVISASNFYPPPDFLSAVQPAEDLQRTLALRQDFLPDAHMLYGLSEVRGLDFPTTYYNAYLNLVPTRIPWLSYGSIFSSADSPLLRLLNLSYVIARDPSALEADANLENVRLLGNTFVAEQKTVQPRAFMVYEALTVATDAEALEQIAGDPEKLFHRIVLTGDRNETISITGDAGTMAASSVVVLSYAPQESAWQVSTDRPGYLFVSDSYYPGWNAYIDGVASPVLRGNIAFRAVYVPSGQHRIEFRFEPFSFRIGLWLSVVATAISAIILLWTVVVQLRAQLRPPSAPVRGAICREPHPQHQCL